MMADRFTFAYVRSYMTGNRITKGHPSLNMQDGKRDEKSNFVCNVPSTPATNISLFALFVFLFRSTASCSVSTFCTNHKRIDMPQYVITPFKRSPHVKNVYPPHPDFLLFYLKFDVLPASFLIPRLFCIQKANVGMPRRVKIRRARIVAVSFDRLQLADSTRGRTTPFDGRHMFWVLSKASKFTREARGKRV